MDIDGIHFDRELELCPISLDWLISWWSILLVVWQLEVDSDMWREALIEILIVLLTWLWSSGLGSFLRFVPFAWVGGSLESVFLLFAAWLYVLIPSWFLVSF